MHLSAPYLFAIRIGLGILGGACLLRWSAAQQPGINWRRWLDAYLLTIMGAIAGARFLYVLLHLPDFQSEWGYALRLWYGGLSWQGALIGAGLVIALLHWRGWLPLSPFLDGIALALPLGWMAVWWGCRGAGCGIGQTVAVKDAPTWQAGYLPDVLGWVERRYEVQLLAILLGLSLLIWVGWLTLQHRSPGRRLWSVIGLMGVLLFALFFLVQDVQYPWLDRVSALGVMLGGGWGWIGSGKRGEGVAPSP